MLEIGFWPGKGYVLHGKVEDAAEWLVDMHCCPALTVADPPYGDILDGQEWEDLADIESWMRTIRSLEQFKCPVYWWGGIGKQAYRPFFQFILKVEADSAYYMRDLITWKKVRAYGKSTDYLFTREECAVFTFDGKPAPVFHVPYLEEKRGYAGYNAKYPAKSEYKRRSNVWCETEILRGKLHVAHKAPAVCRVPIEVHTNPGDLVLDLYAGSGETSVQALKLGRTFVAVESNRDIASKICNRIEGELRHGQDLPCNGTDV